MINCSQLVTSTGLLVGPFSATPTMAAEIAVPLIGDVSAGLDGSLDRLQQTMDGRLNLAAGHLRELLRSYALGRIRGRLEAAMQNLDYMVDRLRRNMSDACQRPGSRLAEAVAKLETLNPRAILTRGYTICSDTATGAVIRSAADAAKRREMRVSFHDGSLRTEIKEKLDG